MNNYIVDGLPIQANSPKQAFEKLGIKGEYMYTFKSGSNILPIWEIYYRTDDFKVGHVKLIWLRKEYYTVSEELYKVISANL